MKHHIDSDLTANLLQVIRSFEQHRRAENERVRVHLTIGTMRFLLEKLASSPQCTPEQQQLFAQLEALWGEVLFRPGTAPTESEQAVQPTESSTMGQQGDNAS